MFLEKSKKYEKFGRVSKCFFAMTLITMLVGLVAKLGFDWYFTPYIVSVGSALFIIGVIIDAIPDFIEKNIKKITLNIIFIIIFIAMLFLL